MANFIYTKCKDALLNGSLNFNTDSIKVLIVNSLYTPNQDLDEFISDIPAGARLVSSSEVSNKTISEGTLDASDVLISQFSRRIV